VQTTCAHCGTPIVDESTTVEEDGQRYCCPNCRRIASGDVPAATPGPSLCAHCHEPIVDSSTRVERAGQTFCCPNCAAAVAAAR
jgi:predicted RNA-binding Zn-ribbon protein involved in translation (DUF1610 family)